MLIGLNFVPGQEVRHPDGRRARLDRTSTMPANFSGGWWLCEATLVGSEWSVRPISPTTAAKSAAQAETADRYAGRVAARTVAFSDTVQPDGRIGLDCPPPVLSSPAGEHWIQVIAETGLRRALPYGWQSDLGDGLRTGLYRIVVTGHSPQIQRPDLTWSGGEAIALPAERVAWIPLEIFFWGASPEVLEPNMWATQLWVSITPPWLILTAGRVVAGEVWRGKKGWCGGALTLHPEDAATVAAALSAWHEAGTPPHEALAPFRPMVTTVHRDEGGRDIIQRSLGSRTLGIFRFAGKGAYNSCATQYSEAYLAPYGWPAGWTGGALRERLIDCLYWDPTGQYSVTRPLVELDMQLPDGRWQCVAAHGDAGSWSACQQGREWVAARPPVAAPLRLYAGHGDSSYGEHHLGIND